MLNFILFLNPRYILFRIIYKHKANHISIEKHYQQNSILQVL